jgi:DNA-binding NarL/FixJ family response regulator
VTETKFVRVLLVDGHPVCRVGVAEVLIRGGRVEVIGECGNARDAFALIDTARPDVVIMEIALPGMGGVVATREIRRRWPDSRVLILTANDELTDVWDAMSAGASGYALKAEPPEMLMVALRAVANGECYLAPAAAARLGTDHSKPKDLEAGFRMLSTREREVFRLAVNCLLPGEIARELCLSRKTVDTHLYRIHLKLNVSSSAELVRLAIRRGSARPNQA